MYILLKQFSSMNNVILLIITFCCLGCKTTEENIILTQNESDEPIILRLSKKYKKIITIKLPLELKIENHSLKRNAFIRVNYNYNSTQRSRSYGISLFTKKNDILEEISNNKKKEIAPFNNREYVVYTAHFLDSSATTQKELKVYAEKMIKNNQDTLAILKKQEFKRLHKNLIKKITKNDSISIGVINGNKSRIKVAIPVNF